MLGMTRLDLCRRACGRHTRACLPVPCGGCPWMSPCRDDWARYVLPLFQACSFVWCKAPCQSEDDTHHRSHFLAAGICCCGRVLLRACVGLIRVPAGIYSVCYLADYAAIAHDHKSVRCDVMSVFSLWNRVSTCGVEMRTSWHASCVLPWQTMLLLYTTVSPYTVMSV